MGTRTTDSRKSPDLKDLKGLLARAYRFAFSLTHDPDRAEDLVQEAWLAVLKADGTPTASYLYAAIRSRFVDGYRKDKLFPVEQLREEDNIATSDESRIWEEDGMLLRANGSLERALKRLAPGERAALYLSAVEGFTAQEIADSLDRPRGSILSNIYRARRKLRRWLTEEDNEQ